MNQRRSRQNVCEARPRRSTQSRQQRAYAGSTSARARQRASVKHGHEDRPAEMEQDPSKVLLRTAAAAAAARPGAAARPIAPAGAQRLLRARHANRVSKQASAGGILQMFLHRKAHQALDAAATAVLAAAMRKRRIRLLRVVCAPLRGPFVVEKLA